MLEINAVSKPNKPLKTTGTLQQKLGNIPSRDGSCSARDNARAADGHVTGRTETISTQFCRVPPKHNWSHLMFSY